MRSPVQIWLAAPYAAIAQPVERILGKDEVASSNLASSSKELRGFGFGVLFLCNAKLATSSHGRRPDSKRGREGSRGIEDFTGPGWPVQICWQFQPRTERFGVLLFLPLRLQIGRGFGMIFPKNKEESLMIDVILKLENSARVFIARCGHCRYSVSKEVLRSILKCDTVDRKSTRLNSSHSP